MYFPPRTSERGIERERKEGCSFYSQPQAIWFGKLKKSFTLQTTCKCECFLNFLWVCDAMYGCVCVAFSISGWENFKYNIKHLVGFLIPEHQTFPRQGCSIFHVISSKCHKILVDFYIIYRNFVTDDEIQHILVYTYTRRYL